MDKALSATGSTDSAGQAAGGVWIPNTHIPHLDGLRGLAILLVTLYRFGHTMPVDTPLGHWLAMQFWVGEHGVELFFVLSGFLITGILVDAKQTPHYFRNFFVRRGLRIFPLYFLSLALMLWLMPLVTRQPQLFQAAREQQFYLWTYLTNVRMSLVDGWCFGSLDHFWSLAVEEHFYLLWPLLVYRCSTRTTLRLALILATAACAGRTAWAFFGLSELAPAVLTPLRCDAMLLGSALAIAVRSPRGLAAWPRWGVFLALPLLVVAVCIDYSQSRLLFLGTTLWTLVWTAALAYLLAAPRNAHIAHFFNQAWLKNLGKLSYGMYVFQSPMIPLLTPGLVVLSGLVAPRHSVSGHLFHMVVLCAATYVMAWFSWHGFEKHWLRLKRGFPGAPQQISAVSSDSEAVSQVQSSLGQMALKGQDRQENRNFLAFFSVFLTKS